MPTLNLNNADKLYYGNTEAQKLYKGDQQLYPVEIVDPYLANVVLYLKGDGENNSTNIVDSSPTPKTITRFGDTKISTAQSKYGGSSIYFDGNADTLTATIPATLTQDFTVEAWLWDIGGDVNRGFISTAGGGFSPTGFLLRKTTPFIGAASTPVFFNAWTLPLNTWCHIAMTRQGNSIRLFLNGTLLQTITSSISLSNTELVVGDGYSANQTIRYYAQMYIDSIRLTYNIARYTANFNPETDTYLAY